MRVSAFKGASNADTYNVEKDGVAFDLTAAGVTKIEIIESGQSIDTIDGGVSFSGSQLTINWSALGDLLECSAKYHPYIYAYKSDSDKGEVLFGPTKSPINLTVIPDERLALSTFEDSDYVETNKSYDELDQASENIFAVAVTDETGGIVSASTFTDAEYKILDENGIALVTYTLNNGIELDGDYFEITTVETDMTFFGEYKHQFIVYEGTIPKPPVFYRTVIINQVF